MSPSFSPYLADPDPLLFHRGEPQPPHEPLHLREGVLLCVLPVPALRGPPALRRLPSCKSLHPPCGPPPSGSLQSLGDQGAGQDTHTEGPGSGPGHTIHPKSWEQARTPTLRAPGSGPDTPSIPGPTTKQDSGDRRAFHWGVHMPSPRPAEPGPTRAGLRGQVQVHQRGCTGPAGLLPELLPRAEGTECGLPSR